MSKPSKLKYDLNLADLFCGGGGFSTGVAAACARAGKTHASVAVNHWEIAARTYKLNHPAARVLCTGLDSVIPTDEVPGGRLDLLAASPECTHHANARGGKPMSNQSRASAWLILKWMQELYVKSVLIENVHEFEDWGPLGANGRPLQSMKGQLFAQFIASLKALGYNVDWRVLNAANYGGATTRERLFIMARRGRNKRLIWPDATHSADGMQAEMFSANKQRWRAAREIIDWARPSQSIFGRKKPLAPATLERIAAGLRKFGGRNAEPFLVVLRNHMSAQSINSPLPTLTASGTHVGLCEPFYFNMQRQGDPILSTDRPMPTITATSSDYGIAQPFVITAGGTEGQGRHPRSMDDPMPTILTNDRHALIQPFIVSYYGTQNVSTVEHPLPTCTTKSRFGLVQFGDGIYLDIHFRMLHWSELSAAMGFPPDYQFCGNGEDKVKMIGNSVEVRTARALAMSALAA